MAQNRTAPPGDRPRKGACWQAQMAWLSTMRPSWAQTKRMTWSHCPIDQLSTKMDVGVGYYAGRQQIWYHRLAQISIQSDHFSRRTLLQYDTCKWQKLALILHAKFKISYFLLGLGYGSTWLLYILWSDICLVNFVNASETGLFH